MAEGAHVAQIKTGSKKGVVVIVSKQYKRDPRQPDSGKARDNIWGWGNY